VAERHGVISWSEEALAFPQSMILREQESSTCD
jgi:hypothetical protein